MRMVMKHFGIIFLTFAGAFSAYRVSKDFPSPEHQWIALQNDADGKGPLASYFQGEQLHTGRADTFTANMYVDPPTAS